MKITSESSIEEFALHFLRSRVSWNGVPRVDSIRNFGTIISLTLYKQPPFQVELFIAPNADSTITMHRHPDVDAIELGLCGNNTLIINDKPVYTPEQMNLWLSTDCDTPFVRIKETDWHGGYNITPASFLSIQKWLNGVEPTSVGFNWEGKPVSNEHEALLRANKQDADYNNFSTKLHAISDQAKWRMTL